ncbi:unnamed protein product, partial [Closterium sp. Yama58-4]
MLQHLQLAAAATQNDCRFVVGAVARTSRHPEASRPLRPLSPHPCWTSASFSPSRRLPRFPALSPVAMPCARMSGLCGGLAALIAGVFAISFLTTHASADADPCVGVDCGLEATCFALSATESVCSCNKDGFSFIEADRTCFAPLVRTTVALQPKGVSKVDVTFRTKLPAEQASGTTACGSTYVKVQGITKITVVWNASNPVATGRPAPSNAMCKSLSFYSDWDCTQKLDFTAIARPAKKGSSYP